jgi:hypothetical protein
MGAAGGVRCVRFGTLVTLLLRYPVRLGSIDREMTRSCGVVTLQCGTSRIGGLRAGRVCIEVR